MNSNDAKPCGVCSPQSRVLVYFCAVYRPMQAIRDVRYLDSPRQAIRDVRYQCTVLGKPYTMSGT
eukprot:2835661-Rhodomonas_salina.1